MKNYKSRLLMSLTILLIAGVLFGNAPQAEAQADQDWTQPVNLSFSGIASNPLLVIDSSGTLHALWLDEVDGYKYSQSVDGGITWTSPRKAKLPFDQKGPSPLLLADGNGYIHIFWINTDGILYYARARSMDLGDPSRWQSNASLALHILNYDVVVDSQGVLHLAYIDNASSDASPAGIYYRQSKNSGGSWTQNIKLYESEYYRSTKAVGSYVSVAAASSSLGQKVYVTWDNRSQKRVFMAVSENAGLNWSEAKQIKGPQDTGGVDSPFDLKVVALENKILLLWQVGEPGLAKCSVFSQWSNDGGESWADTVAILGGPMDCPSRIKFVSLSEDYIVTLMTGQGEPTLIAWNGTGWSDPQVQTQLPTFSNPLTFDVILLGCRFDLVYQDRLYVVGCDEGPGGDVWFLSRSLDPLKNWFSPPTIWSMPTVISGESTKSQITNLSSTTDPKGNLHAVWARSSSSDNSRTIEYAHWSSKGWTKPSAVITSLSGTPVGVSIATDSQGKLLLTWVDGSTGDLFFSWAILDRAGLASEWKKPVVLPSPSNLKSAPSVLADGSGRIVVAYAVPINEDRGVYIVQSTDNGDSWSTPIRAFNAVSAGWDEIEAPKISLSADGVLHLTFIRNAERVGQPVGLYYSRSGDGGMSWSEPQIISEEHIQWSDVVSYGEHTVHILWQEYDGLIYANQSQVSRDSGISWGRPVDVGGVGDSPLPIALASDGLGQLHFIQLMRDSADFVNKQDHLTLQDWNWTGSAWELASDSSLIIQGDGISYSASAGITSEGYLGVSLLAEYSDPVNDLHSEIQAFGRFLAKSNKAKEPVLAVLPIPATPSGATSVPNILPTPPVNATALYDDRTPTTSFQRSLVGVVVIGIAMILIMIWLIRGQSRSAAK